MRKFLFYFIAVTLPVFGFSQNKVDDVYGKEESSSIDSTTKYTLPLDSVTNRVTFSEVVKIENATKDELFTRAREWFAKTFVSAQNVLQMDDRVSGKLIGKGSYGHNTHYTVSITVK